MRKNISIREGERIIIRLVSSARLVGIVKSSSLANSKEAAEAVERELKRMWGGR